MAINRFLQSSVQSGLPKFDSIWDGRTAVGSMEPIGAIVLNSTQSSITFSNIPSTYTHLQIRGIIYTTALVDIGLRVGNNTIDANTNYAKHGLYWSSSQGSAGYANQTYMNVYGYVSGTTTTAPMSFIADILDYTNTNKYKTMKSVAGMDKDANYGESGLYSGVWMSGSAINTISFVCPGTTFISPSFVQIYGIK